MYGNMSKSALSNGGGAALVLVCFFLPWISVSVSSIGIKVLFSGYDLVAGITIGPLRLVAEPILYLTLLAALACLFGAFLLYRISITPSFYGLVSVACGVAGLIPLALMASRIPTKLPGVDIAPEIGAFGTIVGLLLMLGGGIVQMREYS
jgi:hypothetical protein